MLENEVMPISIGFMPEKKILTIKPGEKVYNMIKYLNHTLEDYPGIFFATYLKR